MGQRVELRLSGMVCIILVIQEIVTFRGIYHHNMDDDVDCTWTSLVALIIMLYYRYFQRQLSN